MGSYECKCVNETFGDGFESRMSKESLFTNFFSRTSVISVLRTKIAVVTMTLCVILKMDCLIVFVRKMVLKGSILLNVLT